MANEHPCITNFRRKMEKNTLTLVEAESFDRWRNNPVKCAPGSDVKAAADALWSEFQQRGGLASCSPIRPGAVPCAAPRPASGGGRHGNSNPGTDRAGTPPPRREDTDNAGGAAPDVLGAPFHNPYTFIPFPPADWFTGVRARRAPTPLTMDEIEPERFTGIVEVELTTLSPLLTCSPDPVSPGTEHKTFRALAIGDDVVVPATGVRGSLRNLMSIIAGGTLGYLDEGVWLVQGRDLNLGPKGSYSPPDTPTNCFLAEVVVPGTETRSGKVRLGETRLVPWEQLERTAQRTDLKLIRPTPGGRRADYWVDPACESIQEKPDPGHPWRVKLSGRPVNIKGKREGLFRADGREIELPPALWAAYHGRYRHGDNPELRKGDLVWLEPVRPDLAAIRSPGDVASIQWARWGRRGEQLLQVLRKHHPHMLPDSLNPDGKVDEVTDLFGQVPLADGAAGPFAARVRPENAVFEGAARDGLLRNVNLAPLQPPHPGCAAFYRGDTDPDTIRNAGPLRGFKVYRVTEERGATAPWTFSSQGVYDWYGALVDRPQKVNKTCDLLQQGRTGMVRLACRSLSQRELSLLLLTCSVDWRLGGGKPLGLGVCRPVRVVVRNEDGTELCRMERSGDSPAPLPPAYEALVEDLIPRRDWWQAVMRPVRFLRYPRAALSNKNRIQRGGHVWFQRHASPRKGGDGNPGGLQVLWVGDGLADKVGANRVRAQPLPPFDPAHPGGDYLFGYDLFAGEGPGWAVKGNDRRTYHGRLEPFDPRRHVTGTEQSGGFHGQNRDTRQHGRRDARGR